MPAATAASLKCSTGFCLALGVEGLASRSWVSELRLFDVEAALLSPPQPPSASCQAPNPKSETKKPKPQAPTPQIPKHQTPNPCRVSGLRRVYSIILKNLTSPKPKDGPAWVKGRPCWS